METMEKIIEILKKELGLSKKVILKNKETIKIMVSYENEGEFTYPEEVKDYEEFIEKYENEDFIESSIENSIPNDYIVTFGDFDTIYSIKFQIFYI